MLRAFVPPFTKGLARHPAPWSTRLPTPAAPATPNTPSPASGATTHYTLLSWLASRQTQADVYLDTVTPPVALVGVRRVGFAFIPTLLPGTTYYWQIVAWNDGGSATGPIWSFTTPAATAVIVTLAGVDITSHVRWPLCAIHDARNATPNTASLTLDTLPTAGGALQIGVGSLDAAALHFAGELQALDANYVDHPDSMLWPVTGIDHTFTVNKRRPFGTYVNVSATTIALEWAARYAPTLATTGIQANLPAVTITVDGSEDFMTCLGRLATAIDGVCDIDYTPGILLFVTDTRPALDPLDAAHPPLNVPPIRFTTDLSQIRTRVYGKGHGEAVPCDVAAREPIVPVANAALFTPGGGQAIASTTADGAQSEILTYSGVQLGGSGSLVGPGVQPTVKPTITGAVGAGMSDGARTWAYTFVTGAGESLPSPLSVNVTAETVPTPGGLDSVSTGAVVVGGPRAGAIKYALTLSNQGAGAAESVIGPVTDYVALGNHNVDLTVTLTSAMVGHLLAIARSDDAGANWYGAGTGASDAVHAVLVTAAAVGTAVTFTDDVFSFVTYSHQPPLTGAGAIQNQATIAGVAVGPTGTTQRKVYRTAAGASQLQLQQTIANNTATTGVTDATADASLGANVPTSDTSGLTQATGQVNAGATSLLTAGASPFDANGGWVLIGQQVVRYTGISGNTLTGILASGAGAISTTIPYGSAVVAAPALTGVNHNNGLVRALANGAKVSVWVQRDDTAAQAALGLLELDATGVATDGIREYLITDERRGETSLAALCDADLAIFSRPTVSTSYHTRTRTLAGQTVSIDLHGDFYDPAFYDPTFYGGPLLGVAGDFTIQSVDITFDGPGLAPRYAVQASSVAFTLSDLLRRVLIAA